MVLKNYYFLSSFVDCSRGVINGLLRYGKLTNEMLIRTKINDLFC